MFNAFVITLRELAELLLMAEAGRVYLRQRGCESAGLRLFPGILLGLGAGAALAAWGAVQPWNTAAVALTTIACAGLLLLLTTGAFASFREIEARTKSWFERLEMQPAIPLAIGLFGTLIALRETLEVGVLLYAVERSTGPTDVVLGAVLGIAAAAMLALSYRSIHARIRLQAVFRLSALLTAFVAIEFFLDGLASLLHVVAGRSAWLAVAEPFLPGGRWYQGVLIVLMIAPVGVIARKWWAESTWSMFRTPESTPSLPLAMPVLALSAATLLCAGMLLHAAGDASASYLALRSSMRVLPDWLWSDLTVIGFGLTAAILATALRDRSMRFVAVSIWSLVFTTLAVQAVKRTLSTPRPLSVLPDLAPIGDRLFWGSMPSGHAATALALATAYVLVRSRSWRSVVVVAALAAAVALSRVAVGAHWIGDVLVGAGIGIAGTALGDVVERRMHLASWLATPNGQVVVAAVQVALGVTMLWRPLGYPLAQHLQWLVGIFGVGAGLLRLLETRHESSA